MRFVDRYRGSENAAADVRDLRKLKDSLYGSVLTVETVKDREYHIHRNLLKRSVLCDDQAFLLCVRRQHRPSF